MKSFFLRNVIFEERKKIEDIEVYCLNKRLNILTKELSVFIFL